MMEQTPSDMKSSLRAILIMFYALVIGVVVFLIIVTGLLQIMSPSLEEKNVHNIFLITASLLALLCFVFGTMAYRKKIDKIVNSNLNLNDKFNKYREALIAYYAACEGAALFAVICLFLTGNYWFIVIAITMLSAMWYRMPTKQRLITDLQLSSQEQQEL
jgi:divalent metal cation (Fe/Co/Zn/Cd) transporter